MVEIRDTSFGRSGELSPVDRFGIWLSARSIRRHAGSLQGRTLLDVGCGYNATFSRSVRGEVEALTLSDVELAPDLVSDPAITTHVGAFGDVSSEIADSSHDVILCVSVLEHLWDDRGTLAEFRRIVRPGGVVVLNVPNWLGKRALEFSAFRLGLSPAEEMNDHKRYYDPKDLWPLLVEAGFRPQLIRCRRHKFGLNTLAICAVDDAARS